MIRQSNEHSMKEAIDAFLESKKMKGKLAEMNIIEKWETLVGAMIAKNTKQLYFKDGKLFIHVDSPVLRQELYYSRTRIIDIINKEAGGDLINEVVMR